MTQTGLPGEGRAPAFMKMMRAIGVFPGEPDQSKARREARAHHVPSLVVLEAPNSWFIVTPSVERGDHA
jgi:hypothetical protein